MTDSRSSRRRLSRVRAGTRARRERGPRIPRHAAWVLVAVLAGCAALDDEGESGARAVDPDLSETTQAAERAEADDPVDLSSLAQILEMFVDEDGLVHYVALRTYQEPLEAYLSSLDRVTRTDYETWTDAEQKAFWINAYNAWVLETMIDHHPIEPSGFLDRFRYPSDSIRQIDGVFDEEEHRVLGEARTLDEVRDDVLRERFEDPLVHVALVPAAVSAPPLRREPYQGARLEAQLADQARRFLADETRGVAIDHDEKTVRISRLFEWYADDFRHGYDSDRFAARAAELRGACEFIATYHPEAEGPLEDETYELVFMDYDWSPNRR